MTGFFASAVSIILMSFASHCFTNSECESICR